MATAGETGYNETQLNTWTEIYDRETHKSEGAGLTVMMIGVGSGSTNGIRVRLFPDLHGESSGGTPILPGDREYFRVYDGGITKIEIISVTGSASEVYWGPVSVNTGNV